MSIGRLLRGQVHATTPRTGSNCRQGRLVLERAPQRRHSGVVLDSPAVARVFRHGESQLEWLGAYFEEAGSMTTRS